MRVESYDKGIPTDMLTRLLFLLLAGVLCFAAERHASTGWVLARNAYFEVYAQGGPDQAKLALAWFDQLRQFFDRNRVIEGKSRPESQPPLTVIGFRSKADYSEFKLRPAADAYYTGTSDDNYIVMPLLKESSFPVAAHEYAHAVMHSRGLQLPSWLAEGLAELFSTVQISNQRCEMGGELPMRVNTLRRQSWLPAAEFFAVQPNSPIRLTKDGAALFYAESWAVTDMLVYSPDYAPRFGVLLATLNSGLTSAQAFTNVFGKSQEAVLHDAQAWRSRGGSTQQLLPSLAAETFAGPVQELSPFASSTMLGKLLLATGMWERAEQQFSKLLQQAPANPNILAALGTVRLYKGDRTGAIEYWRKALDNGVQDASLCYRYALLAEEANYPPAEIKRALLQAIAGRPGFDDARYRLAILQSNGGEYEGAVGQLRAMSKPRTSAAFAYWTTLAYALTQLDKREEADDAAKQAMQYATNSSERARASELAFIAKTDLAVQFEHGPDGQQRLVTTRIPHGARDWNPFIEAGDRLKTTEGKLLEVQCSEGRLTGFVVEGNIGKIALAVPDPTHVLIRNGPSEFSCGPQPDRSVKVDYAASTALDAGLLRGMEFR